MFSFKLHLFESCIATIQDFVIANSVPILVDLILPARHENIGNLEMIFVDSANRSNISQHFLAKKSVSLPKRKMQSNYLLTPNKPKMMTIIASSANMQSADGLLTTKANPEALINITQNLTTGDKSFQCSMCGYVSNQKGTVKRHIDLKHLPKTAVFKCQLCEYTASLRFYLKNHYTGKHALPEQAAKAMLD